MKTIKAVNPRRMWLSIKKSWKNERKIIWLCELNHMSNYIKLITRYALHFSFLFHLCFVSFLWCFMTHAPLKPPIKIAFLLLPGKWAFLFAIVRNLILQWWSHAPQLFNDPDALTIRGLIPCSVFFQLAQCEAKDYLAWIMFNQLSL